MKVADILICNGAGYAISGRDSYRYDDGSRVTEWHGENEAAEICLLEEESDVPSQPRWFFTARVGSEEVRWPEGAPIPAWKGESPRPVPPRSLAFRGETYDLSGGADLTANDAPGRSERKVVWDYWDDSSRRNVAVELWPDGSHDCYSGSYIRPEDFEVRPGARQGINFSRLVIGAVLSCNRLWSKLRGRNLTLCKD